jgi:hypothetical protein
LKIISLIRVAQVPEYLLLDIAKLNKIDEQDFKKAIRTLKKYSLIQEQNKNDQRYYLVHDLIKSIVALH